MAVCSSSSCVPADPAGSATGKPGPDRPCFFSMMSARGYCAYTRFSARARLTLNFRDISGPYNSNGVPTRTGSGRTVFETVSLSIDNGHPVQCSCVRPCTYNARTISSVNSSLPRSGLNGDKHRGRAGISASRSMCGDHHHHDCNCN